MAKNGLQYALDLIDRSFGVGIRKAKEQTSSLDTEVNKTNNSVKKLGAGFLTALSINKVIQFGTELSKITANNERFTASMTLNSGKEGQKNIDHLNEVVSRLKINMESSEKGFDSMNKKMQGTGIQAQSIRDIFESVGITALVTKANGSELEAMLNSFGNLAQSGKLSMAQFTSEIGTKIPGALKIASSAMGVSEDKLIKLFNTGQVSADKFLPVFSKELKATFEKGVPESLDGMNAAIENKLNAATGLQKGLAKMFEGGIKETYNSIAKLLNWFENLIPVLEPVKQAIGNLFQSLNPLWVGLRKIIDSFGTTEGTLNGFVKVMNIASSIIEVLATGIGVMLEVIAPLMPWLTGIIALQWAWNIAMSANPIGVVVLAIAALIGGISLAYQKIGWFRGGIDAAWTTIKGFGSAIKEFVIDRFKQMLSGITGMGSALMKFFQGDWKGAWESGKKATQDLMGLGSGAKFINNLKNTGKQAGEAYNKGVAEAENNKKKKGSSLATTANSKFGLDAVSEKTASTSANPKQQVAALPSGGGGRSEKKNIFNIQSFIKEFNVVSNGSEQDIEKIKRMLLEAMDQATADLFVRANE